ncbi:cold-shock protein [Tumebacillus permanentifrigoris]|uniref:Cold-inducible protein YdjO n=1 Tax=Tumebacillus permanentifrigoris TaxID=378543 RepID=A0A316D8P2_9BACL|nr:cold-shock protein [Tumebacillus permanentifrigoris]PWK07019.1 cold-inducible protein YdjO [Tumebacillus permanentifrigoris]
MYYRAKQVEVQEDITTIWSCTNEGCKGWMRDNFAFEQAPTCRLCKHEMASSTKMLPMLANSNGDLKAIKKGVQIEQSLI